MAHSPTTRAEDWKKRSVVSSFILRADDNEPRIALFKRSSKVSTYQHHLAPISGTIDPSDGSPLSTAWREIKEETTLTPASLTLLRQGKPYTFADASIRREWTIFPFLFRLNNADAEKLIQTDWEHEGWGWYDPGAVIADADAESPSLLGVPRLAESLRRVWFEADLGRTAGKVLSDGLDALAHDYESGARQLAGAALQTLRGVVAALDAPGDGPTDEWWVKVRSAAWHLWKNGRESMGAAIMSALLGALAGIEQTLQDPGRRTPWRDVVLSQLDARIAARQKSAELVSRAFAAYLEKAFASKRASHEPVSVLTLSESSTIRQALQHAALQSGFVLDIRLLESRPLYEGVALAGSLASDLSAEHPSASPTPQHRVTLYTDASAALAASAIDVLLLGADRIASSGAVSNKTGSLPAALSAKHVCPAVKVVVLGESEKVAPPGRPEDHVVEDNDPSQVSRAWQAEYNSTRVRQAAAMLGKTEPEREPAGDGRVKVELRNIFFEWVPSGLIDTYITESGEWTVQHITQHSAKLDAERKRFFENL
ncbi:9e231366-413a-4cab-9642-d81348646841 [Thermothielavioides terrestris]|uniref:9e231366-413a-4cab-9642-d81348646841 n=1 Tax=Thermothielavioides terrestris TaxID=2587410 RepID=A0A446BLZ6_9PEZI|nr:9e231366-413a-4cab-9642-d81348646841 [Thermothielavioides terrestris]